MKIFMRHDQDVAMPLDIEKLNRIRKRANRALRVMQVMWMPLLLAYASWLVELGYEAARWYGAIMAVLMGTGYPYLIGFSLSIRSIEPSPMSESKVQAEPCASSAIGEVGVVCCAFCGSDDTVVTTCCGKLACPAHRAGTGTISDGFCCKDHPFGP
jgi:hypothetical protein